MSLYVKEWRFLGEIGGEFNLGKTGAWGGVAFTSGFGDGAIRCICSYCGG